jgi:hypothetical protein
MFETLSTSISGPRPTTFIYAATEKLVMLELKIDTVAYPKPRFRDVAAIPRDLANRSKNWYTE